MLDFRSTLLLVCVVILCACLLSQFHLPLPYFEQGLILPDLYILGILSGLVVSTMFIGFYVWWLADEARRTNAVLAATQLMLEREQQATTLGTLAAAAAHKLGSPLNTISVISHDLPARLASMTEGQNSITEDVQQLGAGATMQGHSGRANRDIMTENLSLDAARPGKPCNSGTAWCQKLTVLAIC